MKQTEWSYKYEDKTNRFTCYRRSSRVKRCVVLLYQRKNELNRIGWLRFCTYALTVCVTHPPACAARDKL